MHHQERVDPAARTSDSIDLWVTAMHFYHNLVVLEKGANRAQAAPAWLRGS